MSDKGERTIEKGGKEGERRRKRDSRKKRAGMEVELERENDLVHVDEEGEREE